MTKKIVLAVALLAVVIAVSYIKSVRGSRQYRDAFAEGKDAARNEILGLQNQVDSLRLAIDRQEDAHEREDIWKENEYLCRIDSLIGVLDSAIDGEAEPEPALVVAEPLVDSAMESIVVSPEAEDTVVEPDVLAGIDAGKQRKIMEYHDSLLSELPGDLTRYERKVARYEVSLETARKFSISIPMLKEVRSRNAATN